VKLKHFYSKKSKLIYSNWGSAAQLLRDRTNSCLREPWWFIAYLQYELFQWTAPADESLANAVLWSPQCAAPQSFQKIKRKSRVSPETDRKKYKSSIGKQGENPSSTEPRYGGNSNRFGLLAHLTVDKQVGNDIGDLYPAQYQSSSCYCCR